jgi:hypothetical protein
MMANLAKSSIFVFLAMKPAQENKFKLMIMDCLKSKLMLLSWLFFMVILIGIPVFNSYSPLDQTPSIEKKIFTSILENLLGDGKISGDKLGSSDIEDLTDYFQFEENGVVKTHSSDIDLANACFSPHIDNVQIHLTPPPEYLVNIL